MIKISQLALALSIAAVLVPSHATVITQEFVSDWTISTWDYYGDVAALRWHYLPYAPWDTSLGALEKVSISTIVAGTKNETEDLVIRYALFTGWAPNEYQFYNSQVFSAGESSFSDIFEYEIAATNFIDPQYLPQANYYFESRSATTHEITAHTTLSYHYAPVSEVPAPPVWSLLVVGGAALAASQRLSRRSTKS